MKICLIMDNPETPRHPVIGRALHTLSTTHDVRFLDMRRLTSAQALAQEERHPQADLYLLKSHAPAALEVAHHLEQRGALVVNSWAASVACQDRLRMAQLLHQAALPWPHTWHFATLKDLLGREEVLSILPFPLMIKSHFSHRGDLVAKVHNVEALEALAAQWSQEPVVLQEFVAGDGWDSKVWVIDQQLFAARRRTPLEAQASKEDVALSAEGLPSEWAQITLEVGRVFDLRLYGVDLLVTERGPIIVDVNAFPGFRGVHGASSALVALVEQLGQERQVG